MLCVIFKMQASSFVRGHALSLYLRSHSCQPMFCQWPADTFPKKAVSCCPGLHRLSSPSCHQLPLLFFFSSCSSLASQRKNIRSLYYFNTRHLTQMLGEESPALTLLANSSPIPAIRWQQRPPFLATQDLTWLLCASHSKAWPERLSLSLYPFSSSWDPEIPPFSLRLAIGFHLL